MNVKSGVGGSCAIAIQATSTAHIVYIDFLVILVCFMGKPRISVFSRKEKLPTTNQLSRVVLRRNLRL